MSANHSYQKQVQTKTAQALLLLHKTYAIVSNVGKQSGYNRKWQIQSMFRLFVTGKYTCIWKWLEVVIRSGIRFQVFLTIRIQYHELGQSQTKQGLMFGEWIREPCHSMLSAALWLINAIIWFLSLLFSFLWCSYMLSKNSHQSTSPTQMFLFFLFHWSILPGRVCLCRMTITTLFSQPGSILLIWHNLPFPSLKAFEVHGQQS